MVGRPGRPGSGVLHPVGATSNFLFGDSGPVSTSMRRDAVAQGAGACRSTSPSQDRVNAKIQTLTIRLWSNARNQTRCAFVLRLRFGQFAFCLHVRSHAREENCAARWRRFLCSHRRNSPFKVPPPHKFGKGNFAQAYAIAAHAIFFALDQSPRVQVFRLRERQTSTGFSKVPSRERLQRPRN